MKSKSQPTSKKGDKPINERGDKKEKAWCRGIKGGEKGKTIHHLYE
jgi:hypothetical protein